MIDHTHAEHARSWVASANRRESDFPIQNLPLTVFRRRVGDEHWRGGVAIGDQIVDLAALALRGGFDESFLIAVNAANGSELNPLMALGRPVWRTFRHGLFALLSEGSNAQNWLAETLVPQHEAVFKVPARIGDYTDFYTSIHHARTISKLFNPESDVPENFRWIPTAYHGRVSSIGLSGQVFRRPNGQRKTSAIPAPEYGPCRRLDYELELGVYVGRGNALGERIELRNAEDHIFGICLLNDWSARDIQAWEMTPLGPFHAKNFATTISPWIVTMEALAPFREPWSRLEGDPQPLGYLEAASNRETGGLDIRLEVLIETGLMRNVGAPAARLSQTSFKHHYWTIGQMITHHTAGGCNLLPGDLIGSGTISGPTLEQAGAMMELSLAGGSPIQLRSGEMRSFVEDDDAIIFKGWCERRGFARIGFGSNVGRVRPALQDTR
jgi:fumarylacetoacetase